MTAIFRKNVLSILALSTALCLACVQPSKQKAHNHKEVNHTLSESQLIKLPSHGFYCGHLDQKGHMWFGTRGDGVLKYDGQSFQRFTTADGLVHNNITCISEDKNGNLLFGTPIGACSYNGVDFINLEIPQSDTSSLWLDEVYPVVNPNQVMSVLEDSRGSLWIGTNGAGVYKYDDGQFTQHLSEVGMIYDDGQHHNIVLTIAEDLEGAVWFSSLSHAGVSRFDVNEFVHFTEELSDDFVRVVYPDSKGNIWIGTHGNHQGGLDKFDGEHFTAFHKTNDGFSHNNVLQIHEDDQGLLWIASGTTELSTFDGEHFELFRDGTGSTYDMVLFVTEDAEGHIWFGGPEGLWKFDGDDVVELSFH